MSYSKESPFVATIKERYSLTSPSSTKEIQHVVLDIGGSDLSYKPGDSIGIYAENHPEEVASICSSMSYTGDEVIAHPRTLSSVTIRDFLLTHANISRVTKKLFKALATEDVQEAWGDPKTWNERLEQHHLFDFLEEVPHNALEPQEFANLLPASLPRFYSIASSQQAVGTEIHLTVGLVSYTSNNRLRTGLGSNYLCTRAPVGTPAVPLYVHPSTNFTLPEDHSTPIIMIGPGTGIAPFRAFMQQREHANASGAHWLFFGERTREGEFLYQEYWEALQERNMLKLHTAFSRDQEHKVYVQDRLRELGEQLWELLEQGAHFYVCGDAKQMAKAVDTVLRDIIQEHGDLSEEQMKEYMKALKGANRYQRDVY